MNEMTMPDNEMSEICHLRRIVQLLSFKQRLVLITFLTSRCPSILRTRRYQKSQIAAITGSIHYAMTIISACIQS